VTSGRQVGLDWPNSLSNALQHGPVDVKSYLLNTYSVDDPGKKCRNFRMSSDQVRNLVQQA